MTFKKIRSMITIINEYSIPTGTGYYYVQSHWGMTFDVLIVGLGKIKLVVTFYISSTQGLVLIKFQIVR